MGLFEGAASGIQTPSTERVFGPYSFAFARAFLRRPSEPEPIADAYRDDGKRSVVRAGEKLKAFVELGHQVLTVTF